MPAVRAMTAAELAASRETNADARDYVRWAMCLAARGGRAHEALALFAALKPHSRNLEYLRRAVVAPGMTSDPAWAGPLVQTQILASSFAEMLRPNEILGRILPSARRIPFNVKVPRQTAGASAGWVGEGKPAPFASLAFEADEFGFAKVGALVAVSKELIQLSEPSAVQLVSTDLVKASGEAVDQQLLDPAAVGSPGISPPSLTSGAVNLVASGSDVTAARRDLAELVKIMITAGTKLASPYWVMSPEQRAALDLMDASLIKNDLLASWPILTSTAPAVTGRITLIDASELNIADGGAELDSREEALVEMAAPATDHLTSGTVLISLWQLNILALKVVRYCNWSKVQAGAVGYIDECAYGLA